MADYPQINGYAYSFASVELNFDGSIIRGVKDINYTMGMERGEQRGTDSRKQARTRGDASPSGDVTMFRKDFDEVIDKFGEGYLHRVFTVTVTYAEDGSPTRTDTLEGCMFEEIGHSNSQGTDPTEVALTLNIMNIKINGKDPLGN